MKFSTATPPLLLPLLLALHLPLAIAQNACSSDGAPERPAVKAAINPAGPEPITSTSQKAKAFS